MSNHILLLNCGSSSMKYQLFDPGTQSALAVGIVERIGQDQGKLKHEVGDQEFVEEQPFPDHTAAFAAVVAAFGKYGPSLDGVRAVGHRTVHGGSAFQESTLINDEVIAKLVELQALAPLHNPPGIAGIEAAMALLPDVPHRLLREAARRGLHLRHRQRGRAEVRAAPLRLPRHLPLLCVEEGRGGPGAPRRGPEDHRLPPR